MGVSMRVIGLTASSMDRGGTYRRMVNRGSASGRRVNVPNGLISDFFSHSIIYFIKLTSSSIGSRAKMSLKLSTLLRKLRRDNK